MKKLIFEGIIATAEWMADVIRNGRPVPTWLFGAVGAAAGGAAGFAFLQWLWLVPGALLGGFVGAAFGAGMSQRGRFPKPLPASVGAVVKSWSAGRRVTVLLEAGVYCACDPKMEEWYIAARLGQGFEPAIQFGRLVPLAAIREFQLTDLDAHELDIVFEEGPVRRSVGAFFSSLEERDAFLAEVGRLLRCSMVRADRPDTFFGATWRQWILLGLIVCFAVVMALLSQHWIANPPPPRPRTGKPDELAQLLVWAGAQGVLIGASLPFLATLGWLIYRAKNRPRVWFILPTPAA